MSKDDRKVVPFPGLHDRYVDKGIEEIKNHDYKEAEQSFRRALELEKGSKAHFGMIMSLYQLGNLEEAKAYCEQLLEGETESKEDFYEYLQIYISILRELKEYEQAIEILTTSLQNQHVPAGETAEKCHQWLRYFLREMEEDDDVGEVPDKRTPWGPKVLKLVQQEEDPDQVEQYREEIRNYYKKELARIKEALLDKEGDPYIKSMILQDLKLNHFEVSVPVYKFDQELTVDIKEMENITEEAFFVSVQDLLTETIESENPSLHKMALQLWEHFMITMFPVSVMPADRQIWGAAIYQMVHEMNGMEINARETAAFFRVSVMELEAAIEQIKETEKATTI